MTLLALGLIVCSSLLHATWNLFAKRVSGNLAFTWLFSLLSVVVYTPIAGALIWYQRPDVGLEIVLYVALSTVLHILYYYVLQRGYRVGDMSLVYPLARGVGPVVTAALAITLLGERLEIPALLGIGLIVAGTFCLTYTGKEPTDRTRASVIYGMLTGAIIAGYTLWDKYAVTALLIPPLLYDWSCNLGRTLVLTPLAIRDSETVRHHWRHHSLEAWGIAVLSPLAYILVLTAMMFTPVSYVAPARELNIVFGTLMGGRLLGEGNTLRRSVGALIILGGIIMLTVG